MKTELKLQITMSSSLSGVVTKFYDEYVNHTPKKLKIIDAYLTYVFLTGVFQVGIQGAGGSLGKWPVAVAITLLHLPGF